MERIHDDELRDEPTREPGAAEEREARTRRRNYARPAVDIYADDAEMIVLADLPGVRKQDLDITLQGDELVIQGKAAGRREEESGLPWGYYRRFRLRTPFDRDRIRARLEEGILEVHLPKAATAQPRKVDIE